MLTAKEVLARAFRALDELAGKGAEPDSLTGEEEGYALRGYMPGAAQSPVEIAPVEPAVPAKMLPDPSPEDLAHASAVLAKAGIRLMRIDGSDYVGIWSDLDGPEVRAALRTYGSHELPVRYLDGDVPMRFKLRVVPGEPVPANVLIAMELEPKQPWVVRDRMLVEMGWTPDGIPWAEWKAQSLNKLFSEQGVAGKPGEIRPGTVRQGESMGAR
jgi:hypothetical protein